VRVQLAPRAVRAHLAREVRERLQLDAVRDRNGAAAPGRGQQHEQPPRAHPRRTEDALGDRVDLTEVEQEPRVGAQRAERFCECSEVEVLEQWHQGRP
jgi:hypothetical protein